MPRPDIPEQLTEQMFAVVGRAITQWSFVEAQLNQLLAVCMGGAVLKKEGYIEFIDGWTAMWIFYAVENFRSKLQVVDAAMTAHLYLASVGNEIPNEWAKLNRKTATLSRKRNKLAHWTVIPAQRTGTAAQHEPIAPARLLPPYGSPDWYRETGFNPRGVSLTLVQVGHLERAFCLLADKLRVFTHKVAGTPELYEIGIGRAMDRLLLDGRGSSQFLAELMDARSSIPR